MHFTALPSHASNVTISKPSDHVARYGLERLMTCCSHRRSSKVLLLFDLGMRPGAVPCGKLLERLFVLTPDQSRILRCISISIDGQTTNLRIGIISPKAWCECHWNVTFGNSS